MDSARDVRVMAAVRVATQASPQEAERWVEGKARGTADPRPDDIAAARRASLEALGFVVTEPPTEG